MEWMKYTPQAVFVLMAITACIGFSMKILEAKDFMYLCGMAFSFFFGITVADAKDKGEQK